MKKPNKRDNGALDHEFVVLDSSKRFHARLGGNRSLWVSKSGQLSDALSGSSNETVWIVTAAQWTDRLAAAAAMHCLHHPKQAGFGNLLLLKPPRQEVLPSLYGLFRRIVGEVSSFNMLPAEQLPEVLADRDRADLFIGAALDLRNMTLTLARGDLRTITVPLSMFCHAGRCKPDLARFRLDDYGYSICFGDYEASAHSVLYEIDAEYRRRVNQRRRAVEKGFGPSLRRLRLLRGLSPRHFPGVSAKTLERIESGELKSPPQATLDRLAKALDVPATEIANY